MIPVSVLRQPNARLNSHELALLFGVKARAIGALVRMGYLPHASVHQGDRTGDGGRRLRVIAAHATWRVCDVMACYLWH
jgi:hypothetical protein